MAVNLDSFPFMEFPLSISRQDGFPLDRYSKFDSFEAAQAYARTSPLAYVSQIIGVVENGRASAYMISDTSGTLTLLSGGGGGAGNVSSPEISTIRVMDQADYADLDNPDENTLYLLRG